MSVPSHMRACRSEAYGPNGDAGNAISDLKHEIIPVPQPKAGEVLVKVKCASVNPIDWKLFTGHLHGICPTNFPYTPGFDISGVVVVANSCSRLAVGDEVCADTGLVESCKTDTTYGPAGAFAEYCVVPESLCAKKGSLTFEQAAAVPLAALTAYEALFTGGYASGQLGSVRKGSKVLVLGGVSAVGAYAIQFAVWGGASVYTTASPNAMPDGTKKTDYCASLGATVINYREKDWGKELAGKDFELIFDCVGDNDDWVKAPKVLKKGGQFISIANFAAAPTDQNGLACTNFLVEPKLADLDVVIKLISDGKVKVPIDSVVPLADVKDALTKSLKGESAGKIIISMESIPSTMKACRSAAYGAGGDPAKAIAALTHEDVPVPEPKPGQVLVKVQCASVNPIDWKLFSGGLHGFCPTNFPYTPGFDISGIVVAANTCTRLVVGDEVCSDTGLVESCKADTAWGPCGAFAEYCVVPEELVSKKGSLSFEQAAAVPLAALTAYEALFTGGYSGGELGRVGKATKVLVLGGVSAVGSYAIQLGVWKGANVTTTASPNAMPDGTKKTDYCASLGATVINYKEAEWSEVLAGKGFDLIFDCVGQNDDWVKAPKVLKKGGKFISIANFSADPKDQDGLQCTTFFVEPKHADLDVVIGLIQEGRVKVPIDSVFPLSEAKAALTKSISGESAGKIVIKVGSMQAFATDGAGSLESVVLAIPSPGPNEVVVKNNAISLNPVDTKKRSAPKGKVLGWDSCGVVTATGSQARRFKIGDRVWFAGDLMKQGTNAEFTAVDERIVSFAPKSVSDADAAALPLVGLTAFEGLTEQLGLSGPASVGKTILVLPGAGGVGSVAIQLAKRMLHMVVIATSSRPETSEYCKRLGADHVINHREALKPQLEQLGFKGVDYIFNAYDTYAYMEQYTDIINPCGGIVSIVECVGKPVDMMQMPMFLKRIHFSWELMFQRTLNGKPDDLIKQATILQQLAHLVDSGVVETTKTQAMKLTLDGLKEAHAHQDSKTAIGKTVLIW